MPKGTEKKKKKIERNVGKHEHGNEKKKLSYLIQSVLHRILIDK